MTIEMRCFARLPASVELGDEILTYLVWALAESDKPVLSALAVASRRTLSIVRPALYDTVCITVANLGNVIATIPTGHFARTQRLWYDLPERVGYKYASGIGNAFCNVQDFVGDFHCSLLSSGYELRPARVTVRPLARAHSLDVLMRLLDIPSLTHLRLRVGSTEYRLPPGRVMHPALGLQHVVLESAAPRWNHPLLFHSVIPFFLSGTHIERVVICAAPDAADLRLLHAALTMHARAHRDDRLWVVDAPATDGGMSAVFRPGVTFSDEQWMMGRPVYIPS